MVAVSSKLKAFNGAFGISYKAFDKNDRKIAGSVNATKFCCSLPIFGIIAGVTQKNKDKASSNEIVPGSGKLLLARGILCGLVVGMPIVLALDIVATIGTQIHQARKTPRAFRI